MIHHEGMKLCLVIIIGLNVCTSAGDLRRNSTDGEAALRPSLDIASQPAADTLASSVAWLQKRSSQMIRDCRRTTRSGIAAFPPQVGGGYEAFWLRDYAYMLEGNSAAFSDKELKDSYRFFLAGQRVDGAMVDCIKFDGTPCYMPGYGTIGRNPVADGSQFTVDVAWHTFQKTRDTNLVRQTVDALIKGMKAVPRNPATGLVYVKPGPEHDRCPYGFTDAIRKQGDELFCSLLLVQASRQLSDLLEIANRKEEAAYWRRGAQQVAGKVREVFWDTKAGLFRAATLVCNQPDIWGSAFAVYIGVTTTNQAQRVAWYFKDHYREIVKRGQLRHLPAGMFWEQTIGVQPGTYQNGAYWATPLGWFVYALDLVDPPLADQTITDLVRDFITTGDENECVNDGYSNVSHYIASVALPLAGIRAMQQRRAGQSHAGLLQPDTLREDTEKFNDVTQHLSGLPAADARALSARAPADWLLRPELFIAKVTHGESKGEIVLENGLVRRAFKLWPNAATVGLDNRMNGASLLRAVEPEASVTLDDKPYAVGGLLGQPDRAYLRPEWIAQLTNSQGAFQFLDFESGKPLAPFRWKRVRHSANLPWPPPGVALSLTFHGPDEATREVTVTVHHELYDGLPVLGKWLTISNGTSRTITIDRLATERLAAVEAESAVDERPDVLWRTPAITVLSDFMFKGMDVITGNQVASWREDPAFKTQVSYGYKTPCVLVCESPIGPGVQLAPGSTFTSYRTWLVIHDSTERERQGLFIRHAHRALAPWSSENPLMMHVRSADSAAFRLAAEQCAAVGFEMIIYTFGSGLDMENEDPAYLRKVKGDVDYAHNKGLQVGAYSLFSSRRVDDADEVINPKTGKPGGAIFGNAPCFGSRWGLSYLRKITNFLAQTGLNLLEHDGPYPGDLCASTNHPGHRGLEDSQWVNWSMTAGLYRWCRERGIYVNQPDYYFFAGANKTAMGYREDNWSLPRAQQLLHARQNIFDGTWTKPQTAGWMFVPLTEYHGGGEAATLEPLGEHLDAYEGHLVNNLGAGVQACWRGPRLYDTDTTKALVKQWVTWFKAHREILESDIIHCRRADGRDIDYLLHVNPRLKERALAVIHNPLGHEVEREVVLPLYYAGLEDTAFLREQDGKPKRIKLDAERCGHVNLKVPAHGHTWLVVEAP